MNQRRQFHQRRRVFVGCEGESEQSYVAVIKRHVDVAAAFHLVAPVLNGGDPLAIVESAKKAIRAESLKGRVPFVQRFVLLDSDLLGKTPARDAACKELARIEHIILIWQEPCHEAMLLRHLQGCETKRPRNTAASYEALRREWPRYRKNMAALELEERINAQSLKRAIHYDLEVAVFLRAVGVDG